MRALAQSLSSIHSSRMLQGMVTPLSCDSSCPGPTVAPSSADFWSAQLPVIDEILLWLHALPGVYAGRAVDAVGRGDKAYLDNYFRRHLQRRRTPEAVFALWKILSRSDTWRRVTGLALYSYLGAAITREARALRRGWEMDGILERRKRKLEGRAAREHHRVQSRLPRPDRAMEQRQARELHRRELDWLRMRIGQVGSARDRRMLVLLMRGSRPADVVAELGLQWSAWQALKRKLQRLKVREADNLGAWMSSGGASGA